VQTILIQLSRLRVQHVLREYKKSLWKHASTSAVIHPFKLICVAQIDTFQSFCHEEVCKLGSHFTCFFIQWIGIYENAIWPQPPVADTSLVCMLWLCLFIFNISDWFTPKCFNQRFSGKESWITQAQFPKSCNLLQRVGGWENRTEPLRKKTKNLKNTIQGYLLWDIEK